MEPLELLKEAREFLSNPDHWCQEDMGINEFGYSVMDPRDAVKCCAVGACYKVAGVKFTKADPVLLAITIELNHTARMMGYGGIAFLNDRCFIELVWSAYDKTIERLEHAGDSTNS